MGAWDELDTEISVTLDTSGLDDLMDSLDFDDVFEPLYETLDNLKTGLDDGSKEGVEDIANRNRSFQEQFINEVCDNPSGMLASSIDVEEQDEYTYLIGTMINHIYPMAVEYGRSEVYPIRAKALAFYYDGELIFRKKVGPAKPRPFVAPAFEKTNDVAEEIMLRKIEIAIDRVR